MAKTKKKMRGPVRNMRPLFVAAYLAQPMSKRNATAAALEAGYSPKTAYSMGARLLKDIEIMQLVREADAPVFDRYGVTADRIRHELALLAFSNPLDYGAVDGQGQFDVDLRKTSRDQAAAITEVVSTRTIRHIGDSMIESTSTKLKLSSKRQALEALGRHLGMFQSDAGPATSVTFNIIGLVASTERTPT